MLPNSLLASLLVLLPFVLEIQVADITRSVFKIICFHILWFIAQIFFIPTLEMGNIVDLYLQEVHGLNFTKLFSQKILLCKFLCLAQFD